MELERNQIVSTVIPVLTMEGTALKKEGDGIMINIDHHIMITMTVGMMNLGMNGTTEEIEDHIEKSFMIGPDITGRIWWKKNLRNLSKVCINPSSLSLKLKRKSHKATST